MAIASPAPSFSSFLSPAAVYAAVFSVLPAVVSIVREYAAHHPWFVFLLLLVWMVNKRASEMLLRLADHRHAENMYMLQQQSPQS